MCAFPVDAVELAFLIDTNQPFLGEWVKNCCLDRMMDISKYST